MVEIIIYFCSHNNQKFFIMRKMILSLILLSISYFSFSQDELTSKKGVPILPEAGDYALGIDATPFINLFGNLIKINNGVAFNDPSAFNFLDGNNTIYGKYFLDAQTAIRVKVKIMMLSQKFSNNVQDDANVASDPNAVVTDTWKHSGNAIILGAGYEIRRGKGRLQGFYGGEVQLSLGGGTHDTYTYGNAMNSTADSIPTTTDNPWTSTGTIYSSSKTSTRTTEAKVAGGFGLGLRGFVGVEYFILPKISLGGEFGWGFAFSSVGTGSSTTEAYDFTEHKVTTTTAEIPGPSSMNLGTDNLGGNIYILVHF